MSAVPSAVLLDTCALIWLANGDPLSAAVLASIVAAGGRPRHFRLACLGLGNRPIGEAESGARSRSHIFARSENVVLPFHGRTRNQARRLYTGYCNRRLMAAGRTPWRSGRPDDYRHRSPFADSCRHARSKDDRLWSCRSRRRHRVLAEVIACFLSPSSRPATFRAHPSIPVLLRNARAPSRREAGTHRSASPASLAPTRCKNCSLTPQRTSGPLPPRHREEFPCRFTRINAKAAAPNSKHWFARARFPSAHPADQGICSSRSGRLARRSNIRASRNPGAKPPHGRGISLISAGKSGRQSRIKTSARQSARVAELRLDSKRISLLFNRGLRRFGPRTRLWAFRPLGCAFLP
jgi:hypothetical protein